MIAPLASVIVPTFNGKVKVNTLLHTLEKQTFSAFEVIVVVDGSTDDTVQEIESQEWNLSALKVIEQKNKGRAGARNSGASIATTDVLIFFDDDMIVDSECIKKHITFHEKEKSFIIMGQVIEPCTDNDTEIKKYKHFLNLSWAVALDPYKNQAFPDRLTVLSAQNFSISKQLFEQLQGFDETLKDIEDYDFALRAKAKQIPVYYLDAAIALHNDTFTFKKYGERSRAYLKNRLLAASLKPALYVNDPILFHQKSVLQRIVYGMFQYPFWLHLLDSFNIFTVLLPKKLRYKLYGIIITAYVHNL